MKGGSTLWVLNNSDSTARRFHIHPYDYRSHCNVMCIEDVRQWEVSFIASRQVQPHDHFINSLTISKRKKQKLNKCLTYDQAIPL